MLEEWKCIQHDISNAEVRKIQADIIDENSYKQKLDKKWFSLVMGQKK